MAKTRDGLVREVVAAVTEFQDGTDEVDEAAAVVLGINRTDLRCVGILSRAGRMTAGQLAAEAGLSTGATTTVIDRLVRAGCATRVRDESDRRRVTVELTPEADEFIGEIWGPIGEESLRYLCDRDDAELRIILDFLSEGRKLQTEHATRIRGVRRSR